MIVVGFYVIYMSRSIFQSCIISSPVSSSHIIILYHHPVSSFRIIISYQHPVSSSHVIIAYHHLVSSSYIIISYHHPVSSYLIIIPHLHQYTALLCREFSSRYGVVLVRMFTIVTKDKLAVTFVV